VVHRDIRKPEATSLMAAEISSPAETEPSLEPSSAASVEAPSPQSAPAGDIESQYAATLRTNIDARTALPSSAEYRLLKPHGEVRVHFTLDRSGMMVASELARSSGSALLDHHALEIVRTGHYPPFPGEAFQGESRHTFLITLEFHS
jgi:periplasmic protein TonB